MAEPAIDQQAVVQQAPICNSRCKCTGTSSAAPLCRGPARPAAAPSCPCPPRQRRATDVLLDRDTGSPLYTTRATEEEIASRPLIPASAGPGQRLRFVTARHLMMAVSQWRRVKPKLLPALAQRLRPLPKAVSRRWTGSPDPALCALLAKRGALHPLQLKGGSDGCCSAFWAAGDGGTGINLEPIAALEAENGLSCCQCSGPGLDGWGGRRIPCSRLR